MWEIMWASAWTAVGVVTAIASFLLGATFALGRSLGQYQRVVMAVDKMTTSTEKLLLHVTSLEERVAALEEFRPRARRRVNDDA